MSLFELRGDVVGAFAANNVFTPALAKAVAQTGHDRQDLRLRLRPRPGAAGSASKSGDLTGSLGQQPFLQGFWPVMQLYLQIDRGISAANLDTRAQLVTKDTVEQRRQALRELTSLATSDPVAGGREPSRIATAWIGRRPMAAHRDRIARPSRRSQLVGGWEVGLLVLMALLYLGGAFVNPAFFGSTEALPRAAARHARGSASWRSA